jgi:uncharacterized protein (DUF2252 family)
MVPRLSSRDTGPLDTGRLAGNIDSMNTHRPETGKSRRDRSPGLGLDQRLAVGKALRAKVPRMSHAVWKKPESRPDPVEVLARSDRGRLSKLLPIRYGRMRLSPFAFFRGSAALMAMDLAGTPSTQIHVQACGDCHAANFGGFASPERQLLFDINDFDETLRAPWEWDLKRLAASVELASRELGMSAGRCTDAVSVAAASYRKHVRGYARMRALDVWYSHLDAEIFVEQATSESSRKAWERIEKKARLQTAEHVLPRMAAVRNGRAHILDQPPLVYHTRTSDLMRKRVTGMFHEYRATLPDERRVVLDRYHVVDVARKVVGVGSVGTRCDVMLLLAGDDDPLLLQFKEALPSVLEPYAGKSRYRNQGERVVTGQRMLQAASDVFLGWTRDAEGRSYYFRQLRDMKMKIDLDTMSRPDWLEYVDVCAWALARAHARTGDAALIAGYLGKSDPFDSALAKFARAYADQTERDHAALTKAIRAGRVKAGAPGDAPES